MNKTAEKIYLYLLWYTRCHNRPPEMADLATRCGCTQTRVVYWLKRLAVQGYIKLWLYSDGDYNIKIMVEETRGWIVNIYTNKDGKPVRATSEVPVHIYIWGANKVVPIEIVNVKDLLTEQLKKKGIKAGEV